MNTSDKPRVLLKSKNIQILMEYCIENKLEFTVIPKASNDEWEVEINVKSIVKAIELGMFMRVNKFDLVGSELFPKPAPVKTVKKSTEKEVIKKEEETEEAEHFSAIQHHEKTSTPPQPALGLDFSSEQ